MFNRANLTVTAGLLALALFAWYFSDIVSYILVAWVLSVVLRPLYAFFRMRLQIGKHHAPASVSAIMCFLVVALVLFLIGYMFVPVIIKQAGQLAQVDINNVIAKISEPLAQFNQKAHEYQILATDQNLSDMVLSQLKTFFKPSDIGLWFQSIISTAGNIVVAITAISFIAFFFLTDHRMFSEWMMAIVPTQHEQHANHMVSDSSKLLTRYFGGLLLQMLFVSLFLWIVLSIFGIKNALLIAIFGAFMNVIPYVGPILGATFGVLITITSNLDLSFYPDLTILCVKVIAIFSAMQMIDNLLVSTYIFSRSVKAHPLEIFLVVMISAKIGGVFGMLIAIPSYTVLRVVARTFLSEYKLVQHLTESMDEQ